MEIPRHWRLKVQRYRLEGSACLNCGELIFPPRPVCPHCTAPPVQIADRELPALLKSIVIADTESQIRYSIMERMIG